MPPGVPGGNLMEHVPSGAQQRPWQRFGVQAPPSVKRTPDSAVQPASVTTLHEPSSTQQAPSGAHGAGGHGEPSEPATAPEIALQEAIVCKVQVPAGRQQGAWHGAGDAQVLLSLPYTPPRLVQSCCD